MKKLLIMIITMSMPAIMEMALHTMLGVADTIMISQFIGKEALAAVGFANQIIFMLVFIFSSFNTGAIALISRSFGEKKFYRLKYLAEQNISLNLFIGFAILVVAALTSSYIFKIFDVTPEVYQDTLQYFNIILVGFLPMFLYFAFSATLRGVGDTLTPMVITGITNVINIFGNYVLILGVGPFPELGIAGAAWATSGSRFLGLFIYIYVLYIKDSNIKLRARLFIKNSIIKPLWSISLPGAVEQGLMQLSFVTMGVIVSKLATTSEASFRILIQIESLSFMPAVGLSIAAATLVGKSLGEKDQEKATQIGYISSVMGILWGVIMGLLFIIFPEQILKLFSKDMDVISTSVPVMFFMGVNQVVLNFVIVISGALRGAGDTKTVMWNTVLRLWIVFVPLSYVFIIHLDYGVVGVWYAEIASFVIFAGLLYHRFRSKKWATLKLN